MTARASDPGRSATRWVIAAAAAGTAASLAAMVSTGHLSGAGTKACVAALLALPFLGRFLLPRWVRAHKERALQLVVVALAHAVPMVVLAQQATELGLFAVLIPLQWHLALRAWDDRLAVPAIAFALMQTFAALTTWPSALTVAAVPATLLCAIAAALLVHGRAASRRARPLGAAHGFEEQAHMDTRGRVRAAFVVSLLVLVLTVVGQSGARTARRALAPRDGEAARAAEDAARRRPGSGGAGPGFSHRATYVTGAGARTFFSDIQYTGTPGSESYETVMQVTPFRRGAPTGNLGPLYLRASVHDTFTFDGIHLADESLPPLRRDEDDGATDGWTRFPEVPPDDAGTELEIYQLPAPYEPTGWSLLLASYPVSGVSLPGVHFDPDRVMVPAADFDDWFTYRVALGRSQAWFRSRALHPDPLYTRIPDEYAAVRLLSERASELTSDRETSFARVRAIVEHFRRGGRYEYSLTDGAYGGLDAVADFIERRKGYCVHFASATVLMLRSLGVPCRVASGYLVSRWNATAETYDVLGVDAHAWVEVHFEDAGWVRFDPTPPVDRERALENDWNSRQEGLEKWGGDLVRAVRAWISDPGGEGSASEVAKAILRAPALVVREVSRSPLALTVLAAALAFLGFVAIRRRLRMRPPDPIQRDRLRAASAYESLLRALAKRGYRRAPAKTPLEFARAVRDAGGPEFGPLVAITRRIYAARFGCAALEPRDLERIERFASDIRGG